MTLGKSELDTETARAWVLAIIATIPPGEVRSYGDIARFVYGSTDKALAVGTFIAMNDEVVNPIPWHRVVLTGGELSPHAPADQRARLEHEGHTFDEDGRLLQRGERE